MHSHTTVNSDEVAVRLTRCSIDELHELVFTACCLAANSSSDWKLLVRDHTVLAAITSNKWTLAEYSQRCSNELYSSANVLTNAKLAMKHAFANYV